MEGGVPTCGPSVQVYGQASDPARPPWGPFPGWDRWVYGRWALRPGWPGDRRDQLALQRRPDHRERALARGFAARRSVDDAERQERHITSPLGIRLAARGHRAGAGDRWRRRAARRGALRHPGVQQLTWWNRWPGGGWSQALCPFGAAAGAIPVSAAPRGDGIAGSPAAADASSSGLVIVDGSTAARPRACSTAPFFQHGRRILMRPAVVFATQAGSPRPSARCTFETVRPAGAKCSASLPLRLGAMYPSGWWSWPSPPATPRLPAAGCARRPRPSRGLRDLSPAGSAGRLEAFRRNREGPRDDVLGSTR